MNRGMRSILFVLVLALLAARAAEAAPAKPSTCWAAVRIQLPHPDRRGRAVSGSGAVIWTQPGRSWVLTCAHLWLYEDEGRHQQIDPDLERRAIMVDAYVDGTTRQMRRYQARRTRIDPRRDLALLEIAAGPLYCCHVLPPDRRPGALCVSVGYDRGALPAGAWWARRTGETEGSTQYTAEGAQPGRSGGPLIDVSTGRLVGVVHGVVWRADAFGREAPGSRRGSYASHASICAFLGQSVALAGRGAGGQPAPPPRSLWPPAPPASASGPAPSTCSPWAPPGGS